MEIVYPSGVLDWVALFPFVQCCRFVSCRLETEAFTISILMGEKRSDIVTCLQMCLRSSGFQPTLGRVKSCFLGISPENYPLFLVLTISQAQVSIFWCFQVFKKCTPSSCPIKEIPDSTGIVSESDEAEISEVQYLQAFLLEKWRKELLSKKNVGWVIWHHSESHHPTPTRIQR